MPRARLNVDETTVLFMWLAQGHPSVPRGRFGFAQYFSIHAPEIIRTKPHGVLVELVQLLLNQKASTHTARVIMSASDHMNGCEQKFRESSWRHSCCVCLSVTAWHV